MLPPPTVSMHRGAGRCASLPGEGSPVTLPIFTVEGEPHAAALVEVSAHARGGGVRLPAPPIGKEPQSTQHGGVEVSLHPHMECGGGGGLGLFAHCTAAGVLSLCISAWRGNLCALHPCAAGRGHHFTSLLQGSTSAFYLHMGGGGGAPLLDRIAGAGGCPHAPPCSSEPPQHAGMHVQSLGLVLRDSATCRAFIAALITRGLAAAVLKSQWVWSHGRFRCNLGLLVYGCQVPGNPSGGVQHLDGWVSSGMNSSFILQTSACLRIALVSMSHFLRFRGEC